MQDPHDDRFDAYLEGEIGFEELPEILQGEERLIASALETVRVRVSAPPSLKTRVMADIGPDPVTARPTAWRTLLAWFVRPRTIHLSPATGMALAAAALAALLLLPADDPAPVPGDPSAALPSSDPVLTRFVFVAPEASRVTLTGDWVDWDRDGIALTRLRGSGVWTVDVPVPPGVHEYSFIVDGTEWRPDPLAGEPVDDGFGRANSVLMVAASEA